MKKLSITTEALTGIDSQQGNTRRRGNRTSRIPEIIEASIRVLLTAGYAGYSVTQVANESDILLSTLQHYFPTRDQLLTATIREFANRQIMLRWEIVNNVLIEPLQRLNAIVDLIVSDFADSETGRFVMEVWALSEHEQFAGEFVEDIVTQYRAMFEKIILEISPKIPTDERLIRAAMIATHAQGLIIFLRHSGRNAPDLAALTRGTKAVWHALVL